jgi:hypothetical protein
VVGHTPQIGGIRMRFGGRAFLIDTGILSGYFQGGRPSALEINAGTFTAVYPNERVPLLGGPSARAVETPSGDADRDAGELPGGSLASQASQKPEVPASPSPARIWLDADGRPLPFKTDEEVMEFLRTADVRQMKTISEGVTHPQKVLLEKNGIRVHAAFRTINEQKDVAHLTGGRVEAFFRDSYIFECAAYELARLLGLDNVPPVVERRIQGVRGSLQIWVEGAMTEGTRLKKKLTPPDVPRWNRQIQIMRIFDGLVFNTDRNLGNIIIDRDWKVWMIDHTRAFRRHEELENPKGIRQCDRKLWQRLQALDAQETRQRLHPYLLDPEISALLKRRDRIVELIRQLIAEKGEDQVLFDLD